MSYPAFPFASKALFQSSLDSQFMLASIEVLGDVGAFVNPVVHEAFRAMNPTLQPNPQGSSPMTGFGLLWGPKRGYLLTSTGGVPPR